MARQERAQSGNGHDRPVAETGHSALHAADQNKRLAVDREPGAGARDRVDERERLAAARETAADERDRTAHERETRADERDRLADQRENAADEREHLADARETAADDREWRADQREHAADKREQLLDDRAGGTNPPISIQDLDKLMRDSHDRVASGSANVDRSRARIQRTRQKG